MKSFSLGAGERLKSRTALDELFLKGQSLSHHGIRLLYMNVDFRSPFPVQTGFVVSARRVKNASDRNRIRRQMKEAFRLNKTTLYETLKNQQKGLNMAWLYQGGLHPVKGEVKEKIIVLLQRLITKLNSGS